MSLPTPDRRLAAGILGSLTLLVIGWTGLLVPSLIRSIQAAFDQNDAGIGVVYLVLAACFLIQQRSSLKPLARDGLVVPVDELFREEAPDEARS